MDFGASIDAGYFHDDYGLSTGVDGTNNQQAISSLYGYPYLGSHLVRTTVVPIPAALLLFGSGIVGLFGVAYRRAER